MPAAVIGRGSNRPLPRRDRRQVSIRQRWRPSPGIIAPVARETLGAFCRVAAAVSVGVPKMADGDIDLYADDLEQDFAQVTRISLW